MSAFASMRCAPRGDKVSWLCAEIIAWNNKERDLRLSDLPAETQEYMEDYIAKFVPRNRVVYHWFDVYDLEEERL